MKNSRKSAPDPLEAVELKIARRADQLAASSPPFPARNFDWWTEAEREILGTPLSPSLVTTDRELI